MKMTKYMRFLIALGAGVILAACAREPSELANAGKDGAPETVSFTVGLRHALTKADGAASTELDDASGSFQLYVAAFDKTDGSLAAASMIGGDGYAAVAELDGGQANDISLSLPSKREYKVIFFAQRTDAYDVRFADGGVASFSFKDGLQANDASLDAFWASVDVSAASPSYEITLIRPFAQLNVLVPAGNVPAGQTAFRSTLTVLAPTRFDLYNGTAGTTLSAIDFAENAIAAEAFGKYADAAKPYTWIGTAYVLVPASGQVDVKSFREAGMEKAVAPGLVPVRMNGRTNLVGNVYGTRFNLAFSVLIDSDYSDSQELYPILNQTVIGCYFRNCEHAYVAGADQLVREYDGHALTFALVNPAQDEQLVISGYADTMQLGDMANMSVRWTKGSTQVLSSDLMMHVIQDKGGLVWIADEIGNGIVIKK